MKRRLFAALLAVTPAITPITQLRPAIAQTNVAAVSPDTQVSLPGLYYDPDAPTTTFSQLPGAEQAGYVDVPPLPDGVQLPYLVDRAWPQGATPDQIIKFGDLDQNPVTADFTKLSVRQLTASSGTNIGDVPVGDVALLNGLTIQEVDDLYTKINNGEKIKLKDAAPALQAAFGLVLNPGSAPQQLQNAALTVGERVALEKLSKVKALEGVPLQDLARGNWEGVIDKADQIKLAGIGEKIGPTLKKLPVKQIVPIVGDAISGDWRAARRKAIALAQQKGTEIAVKELLKEFPQLKDVPIAAIPGVLNKPVDEALPEVADLAIEHIPGAKDKTINSLPGLEDIPINELPLNLAFSFFAGDVFARFDIAYSGVEGKEEPSTNHALSGGSEDQKFKPIKCTVGESEKQRADNCPHFEMRKFIDSVAETAGLDSDIEGKQWVQGDSRGKNGQGVKGGKGLLKWVNGGWEPAGIHPFGTGSHTKFVLKKITEYPDKKSTARLYLALQTCFTLPILGQQCTPHWIVLPTPYVIKEDGLFLVASRRNLPADLARLRNGAIRQSGLINQVYCDPDQIIASTGQIDSSPSNSKYGHLAYDETTGQLVNVTSVDGVQETLAPEAAQAFEQMRRDAASQGLDIKAVSGFRSVAVQQSIWDNKVASASPEVVAKTSAPPGHSEHHTGLAVDVGNNQNASLNESWAQTPEYAWMEQNAGKYGFELSFPQGNSQGVSYEPWHWRFVGSDQAQKTFANANGRQNQSSTASSNGVLQPIDGSTGAPKLTGIPGQPGSVSRQGSTTSTPADPQHNVKQYLARIALGESSGGTNIGPHPDTGAYGEYQFIPETRRSILNRYGVDAWSTNKAERDQATLALIRDFSGQIGTDIMGLIEAGDFAAADVLLGRPVPGKTKFGQFTSLPGGAEAHEYWDDPATLAQYGPSGDAGTNAPLLASNGLPCNPGAIASSGRPLGKLVRGKGEPGKTYPEYYDPAPGVPINSERGWRWGKWHAGVDQAAPEGTPVLATNGGNVVAVFNTCTNNGDQSCGYGWGNHIIIRHEDGTHSKYAHLSPGTIAVAVGMDVGRGDQIAGIGNTGHSTGPHLHYEHRINTNPNDPYSGVDVSPRDYVIFGG